MRLKLARPDRRISALCLRGVHQHNKGKMICKGRSCVCDCHPRNEELVFCSICESRRIDKKNTICEACKENYQPLV